MQREPAIFDILSSYYPERISFLPVISPFRFLVTVMLSASTTDRQAEAAAERLFSRFSDAGQIMDADEDEIELLIRSAGLSRSKARNIKGVARYAAEHGIPEDMEGLTALPGIGEKTASCYLAEILGKPAVIADTHFVRVARRLGYTDTSDRSLSAREIRQRFPEQMWTRLSMVLNLHGRTFCKAKPICSTCPVSSLCPSSEAGNG